MLLKMKKKVFITIHVIIHLFLNLWKNKEEVIIICKCDVPEIPYSHKEGFWLLIPPSPLLIPV